MNTKTWIAIVAVVLSGAAHGQASSVNIETESENITEANANKANAIIAEVIEAFGGREALQNLKTVVIESDAIGHAVGQSRKPGPPWDTNRSSSVNMIDLEHQYFVGRNTEDPKRYRFDQGQIVTPDYGWQINYRAGTMTAVEEPDYATRSGPFTRITSTLLIHQLMQRSFTATYLGQTAFDNRPHDVLSFVMEVGPAISLYIDQETRLLSKSERVLPNFGLVEYVFGDYRNVDGIAFNHHYTFYFQGAQNDQRTLTRIRVNEPINPYIKPPKGLKKIKAQQPDTLAVHTLADGVHLIGGNGTYALFVDMGEHFVAVGGTGGSDERIELLRAEVSDKPIRYGVFTHHHSDHVLAAPSYIREQAILMAHPTHENTLRAAAGDDVVMTFESVSGSRLLSNGARELHIIDLGPTAHSEHLLAAYLPKERVLFSADHFAVPAHGRVQPATHSTQQFAAALERKNLDIKLLLSAHSPKPATMKQLRKSLSIKPSFKDAF